MESGKGTNFHDLPRLLDHYGMQSTITDEDDLPTGRTNFDVLAEALDGGHKVLVALNAETIWDIDGDRSHSDHILVVTGLDTDANVVHLNDSGTEDGCDEQVSRDTFDAAWGAAYHSILVTTQTA